ncbi:hypothetical protein BDA96_07G228800 [Sorghum bicolor]|uniref:Uncharacterized protein n=1 Tax=Sorghum bicolor TaxID=4558 RepID=A0A921UAT7_SORBI|nr:hypothetical protein BDA96_07G228800 [Sorghum bicolor]
MAGEAVMSNSKEAQRQKAAMRTRLRLAHCFVEALEAREVAAARWDAVRVGRDPDMVLVVDSLFKLETLANDNLVMDRASPLDSILGDIRRMRQAMFTHSVINGLCGNLFLTRFREALFDVLDAMLPRGSEQCRVLEQDVCVVNVVT